MPAMLEDLTVYGDVIFASAVKLAVALVCGFLLGMEREINEKPAGLRTLMLITVGSTLFMIVSTLLSQVARGPEAITRVDPSRIASQVVTGIGFLGAGVILHARGSIRGLTTAAAIWVASGVGLCIGAGFPIMGFGITLVVLGVLVVLEPIRAWLGRRGPQHEVRLVIPNDVLVLGRTTSVLRSNDVPDDQIHLSQSDGHILLDVVYHARRSGKHHLLDELAAIEGLHGAPLP